MDAGPGAKIRGLYKAVGGDIAAAEFFNEPDMPVYGGAPAGYNAGDYARDSAIFREFAKANAPDMAIVGPGPVGEAVLLPAVSGTAAAGFVSTNAMLSAVPAPKYDVFSYHFYGAASMRCPSMGRDADEAGGRFIASVARPGGHRL